MNLRLGQSRRRAVSGILVAVIIFAMLFTAGTGYLFFQARSNLSSYEANVQALQKRAEISQEQLSFRVSLTGSNNLEVMVNDTGAYPISIVDTFVNDSAGKVVSPPGVMTLGVSGTTAGGPLNLNVGGTGNFTITSYTDTLASGTIHVALVTSRGNVFTQQYPFNNSVVVSTITSETTVSLTGPNAGGAGGNSLVVVMSATPVQVFSGPCPGLECITDNVTLFNYSRTNMTGAGLHPTIPWFNVTGTAELTGSSCSGPYTPPGKIPDPNGTIPGYSGAGVAPHIYFLCTYAPQTGAVGGLASFSGWAFATQNKTVLDSASVVSNLVQIGGLTNVYAQGAFSTNFFFFKYSSCIKGPSQIALSPSHGRVGDTVNVTGIGFAASTTITVKFNGATVTTIPATVVTSSAGAFSAKFKVPASPVGGQMVTASDVSANTAPATFTVTTSTLTPTITLSPTQAPVGTVVTVTGYNFTSNSTITVKFNGATQMTVPHTITADATGAFTATFSVPSSPTGIQTVTATDASANTASTKFSVGNLRYSATDTCIPNTSMPPSSPNKLPEGAVISGGSNFYVAFYIQITNNYNVTIPLLQYTFLQVDPSDGGETDWWLVGTNTTMSNGAYYPTYDPATGSMIPTLTPYPSDCGNVNSTNGRPYDSNCIYVNPGKTVTITFAACGFSSSNWDWGGYQHGNIWDNGNDTVGCIPGGSTPSIDQYYAGDATAATTVISFEYKGETLTEDIAFNGIAFTS